MAEKAASPEVPVANDDGSLHPTEPAEGAPEPGDDDVPRPPRPDEPAEGRPEAGAGA